jgi:hypothetical protein
MPMKGRLGSFWNHVFARFAALFEHRVKIEGMLLKPNIVPSGKECPEQAKVADAKLQCFHRIAPAAALGVVFLSGVLGDVEATRFSMQSTKREARHRNTVFLLAGRCNRPHSRLGKASHRRSPLHKSSPPPCQTQWCGPVW